MSAKDWASHSSESSGMLVNDFSDAWQSPTEAEERQLSQESETSELVSDYDDASGSLSSASSEHDVSTISDVSPGRKSSPSRQSLTNPNPNSFLPPSDS